MLRLTGKSSGKVNDSLSADNPEFLRVDPTILLQVLANDFSQLIVFEQAQISGNRRY
jgi:hypothetical protein